MNYVDKTKETELVRLCRELIQKKSYSGEENLVVESLKTMFARYGFGEITVDEYGSLTASLSGNRPGPTVLLDAHIDTVPVPEPGKWKYDPFGAEVADGKIYGRGTSDMKGALSAMILAAADFAQSTAGNFAGKVVVAGVVHEECFEGIAARSISKRIKPDYVVIGEASELNLKIAQRGRAEIVVETLGVPAHSANPDKGVNAVYAMAKLILEIRKLAAPEHPVLGKGILELTDIKSSPYPGASVVPEHCRATFDRRLLVGERPESVLSPLQELIGKLSKEDPRFVAKVDFAYGKENCHTGATIEGSRFFPGWLYEPSETFVKEAHQALGEAGIRAEITQYSFCTNASHYAGEAKIKTLGFGPSRENLAHVVDEYVEIEQLSGAYQGYKALLGAFLK